MVGNCCSLFKHITHVRIAPSDPKDINYEIMMSAMNSLVFKKTGIWVLLVVC